MATTTQTASSTYSVDSWAASTSGLVADVSTNDGDTSFDYMTAGSPPVRYIKFNFPSLPGDAVAINSCTISAVAKNAGAGSNWLYVWDGYQGTGGWLLTASYATYSANHHYSTVSEINSAVIGFGGDNSGAVGHRVTYHYRYTDYVQAGGCFIPYSFFPPLIGPALIARELAEILRLAQQWHRVGGAWCRTRYSAAEIRQAWRLWRDGPRFARHFDMGKAA